MESEADEFDKKGNRLGFFQITKKNPTNSESSYRVLQQGRYENVDDKFKIVDMARRKHNITNVKDEYGNDIYKNRRVFKR
jgi:hypothetical protein